MKKHTIKSFCLGAFITVIIVSLIGTALASTGAITISVNYNDLKVVVDGSQITPKDAAGNTVEPFSYNGTIFLPARALANALGKEISYNGDTHTAYIGTQPNSTDYSRTNPAPIGTEQTISITNSSQSYSVKMKINSASRGSAAWSAIYAANKFNTPAPSGKEYITFEVTATVISSSDGKSVDFSDTNLKPYSGTNTEYQIQSVVNKNEFDGNVYVGGTLTGWVSILVDQTDKNPKVVYGRNYDGTGGIWFDLSKAA